MRALSRTRHATPFLDRRFIAAFRFGTGAKDKDFLRSVRPWDQDEDRLNLALRGLTVGDLAYRGISWCESIPTVINENSWNHILQPKHGLTRDIVGNFIQHICIPKNLDSEIQKDVGRLLTYKEANVVAKVFEHKDGRLLLNNAFVATKGAADMGAMASSRAASYAVHGIVLGALDSLQAYPDNQSAAFVGAVVGGTASTTLTSLILSSNPLSLPTAAVLGFSSAYTGAILGGQLAVFLTDEKIDTFGSDTARSPAQLGQQLQFLGMYQKPFHPFRWNENYPNPDWDDSVKVERVLVDEEYRRRVMKMILTLQMNDYSKAHMGIEIDKDTWNVSPTSFGFSIDTDKIFR